MNKIRANCNWCSHYSAWMNYQTQADYAGVQHAKQSHSVADPAVYTDYKLEGADFCDYCEQLANARCYTCNNFYCGSHGSKKHSYSCYKHDDD